MFIARLADHYQVQEYAGDVFYKVREQDMHCLYGDWKGEQPKVHHGRIIRPAQAPMVPPPEQHLPSQQLEPSQSPYHSHLPLSEVHQSLLIAAPRPVRKSGVALQIAPNQCQGN
ncbi:hypothetical protein PIB30_096210, partial [Stylosanthes scabra]|nr:hypothetical protein [Stylosanthes scabra]